MTFAGIPAVSFVVVSDTSITAIAPVQAAGVTDIVVTTPTGTLVVNSGDEFTYTAASSPTVTALSLSGGSTAGGTVVTITGTNLTGLTGVNFGTVAAAYTLVNDTQVVATAPAQAAGTIDVTVITAAGTSATSSADHFTYSAPAVASISAVTPNSGSSNGGDTITLTGSGFSARCRATFGSTPAASFSVLSDTTIVVTTPAVSAATIDITVTTPSGTSTVVTQRRIHVHRAVRPHGDRAQRGSGPDGGGTVVTITGTNFLGTSQVSFGAYAASSVTVASSTQITAVAPPQAAGTVDITVTTPAGTSATSGSDQFTYSSVGAPTVTLVSPNAGPTAGGNTSPSPAPT